MEEVKLRIVRGIVLANALVWLGFAYKKDEEDNYVFERSYSFDKAWDDLHYMRSIYDERVKK